MPFSERKGYFAKLILNQTILIPLFFFLCTIALPSAFAATVNLAWNPSTGSNVAGYKMYYGTASRNYSYNVNVGKSTSCSLSGLTAGKKYYFAATAYNTSNAESSYSSEISYTVPTSSTSSSTTSSSSTTTNPSGLTADYNSSSTIFAFEAEGGDVNKPMVTAGDNNASSGTYILTPNGGGSNGYAAYTFQVTSAGNYIVWGRILAPSGVDDSFFVAMDGGADSTWDITSSTKWVWDKVSHRGGADPVVYNLATGKHTLLIKQREDGAKLDCVVITKDMNTVPSATFFSSSSTSSTSSSSSTSSTTSSSSSTSNTTPTSSTSSNTTSGFTDDYDSSQTAFAFEAEDGDIHNAMVTAGDNNASSGTYILVPNGGGSNGYATYTFQVTSAGNYVVWGRVLAPNGSDDSFYVSVDGGSESAWATTMSTKWVWDKVSHMGGADPVVYNLATGKHTLTIKQREDGTKIDCVVITKNSSSAPSTSIFNGSPSTTTSSSSSTSSPPVSTTESVNAEIEAEDGIMSGPMERVADNSASSGMYIWVRNGGGSGGSAKYSFEVTKAGKYIIWGRVLAPNASDDSFYVSVDGGSESTWDTTISTKWVWDKVSHRGGADPVAYNLSTGNHTLVIKQREDGAKLDEIIITDDLNFTP